MADSKAKPKTPDTASKAGAAPARTAGKRPAAKKVAAKAKVAPKAKPAPKTTPAPKTVSALHAHLERVADKLGRADARHARQLRTLKEAVAALETTTADNTAAERTSMRRHIRRAQSDLATASADIRARVRRDLKDALAADGAERMTAVLKGVEERLEASERDTAARLARLSSQLAEIARAVDARVATVETARAADRLHADEAIDAVNARIDAVERDTAQGLGDIGERMVELATSLRRDIEATRTTPAVMGDKLDTISDRTSTEISAVRAALAAQVEATQRRSEITRAEVMNATRQQDAVLAALSARLENLEYALSQPIQAQSVRQPAPDTPRSSGPRLSNVVELGSALQGTPSPTPIAPSPIAPSPIAPSPIANARTDVVYEPADSDITSLDRPDHFPVEFVPSAPMPSAPMTAGAVQLARPAPLPAPQLPQPSLPPQPAPPQPTPPQPIAPQPSLSAPDIPAPNLDAPAPDAPMASRFDASIVPEIGDADLPYLNPGYAETGSRIGGAETKPGSAVLAALKGRNVRIAGAAVAAGLVGLLAINALRGGDDTLAQPQFPSANISDASADSAALATPPAPPQPFVPADASAAPATEIVTTAPIGDTSALDVPLVDPATPAGQSLAAAVAAGNPVAEYQMGLIRVEEGEKDEGIALVRRAADRGLPAAQYRLAKFYEQGDGVAQDYPTAARLTELAARAGHRIAMHDLGLFHAEGLVTGTPDRIAAVEWFDKASRMGVVDSQYNLAYLLDQGESFGVARDAVRAYAWYAIAARNGDQQAGERLAGLQAELTSEQLTEAEARIAGFEELPTDDAVNGIFRDLPWAPPPSASLDRAGVREVQSLLNQLGFDTGTPDGLAGAKTAEAIVSYERSRALPETGRPTPALLSALESDVGA